MAIHSYLIVKFVLDYFGLFGLLPRNDAQPGVTPRPIGESGFADSGEGLNINRTITHPSLPSYREGTRADAQLTYSPRPFGRADLRTDLSPDSERIEPAGALLRRRNSVSVEQIQDRAEFVSELCELRNSGEGLKNYHSKPYTLRGLSWICSTLAKPHFRSRAPVRSFCSLSGLPH